MKRNGKLKYVIYLQVVFFIFVCLPVQAEDIASGKEEEITVIETPLLASFISGDCDTVISELKLNAKDKAPWTYFQLGVCYEEKGDFKLAAEHYKQYIDSSEKNVNVIVVEEWQNRLKNNISEKDKDPSAISMNLLQKYQIGKVAKVFHQKPGITKEELEIEISNIQQWLTSVLEHLGAVGDFYEIKGAEVNVHTIGIAGGDIPYWKDFNGNIETHIYAVEFNRVGSGYIIIETTDINDSYEIAWLFISLPETQSNKDVFDEFMPR